MLFMSIKKGFIISFYSEESDLKVRLIVYTSGIIPSIMSKTAP